MCSPTGPQAAPPPGAGLPRWFDLLATGLGACLLAPLFLLVWLLVRLDSAGPALFRQCRVGRYGRTFTCLKFRTMVDRAPTSSLHLEDVTSSLWNPPAFRRDPRLTRLGPVLRQTSLDELPQLLNVIRGDMALVGPRPELPDLVAQYPPNYHRRHAVLPGITGLAQVSGRSDLIYDRIIHYDLFYVVNRTPMMSLQILWRTLAAVFRCKGAR